MKTLEQITECTKNPLMLALLALYNAIGKLDSACDCLVWSLYQTKHGKRTLEEVLRDARLSLYRKLGYATRAKTKGGDADYRNIETNALVAVSAQGKSCKSNPHLRSVARYLEELLNVCKDLDTFNGKCKAFLVLHPQETEGVPRGIYRAIVAKTKETETDETPEEFETAESEEIKGVPQDSAGATEYATELQKRFNIIDAAFRKNPAKVTKELDAFVAKL